MKVLSVILMFCGSFAFGQINKSVKENESINEPTTVSSLSADDALKAYMSKRQGYKRSNTKQFSRTEQFEMDDMCHDMDKNYPDSWQTNFAWYLNGHYYSNGDKLIEAYEKAPNEKAVAKAMFGYYAMNGNLGKQKEMVSKISGYYSANTLSYYEDVFPSSGVVIVSSEQEAIPLYVLQLKKGKGKGITVVNMDYLINDDYRKRMANKLGTGSQKFFGEEATFINTAMSTSNVYLSTTVSQGYLTKLTNTSFVTGLSYEKDIKDQRQKLEKFWGKLSKKNFASMSLTRSEKRLYSNYLPPLLTLYKIKMKAGEKDDVLRKGIVALAKKVEQTKTVDNILMEYENG